MLRIRSIELKNFKNIHTGLHTRHLTIDFSMQKNPMCIIVGDNGKGKTSLLSYLSPFATLGTFDVRDTNKLIIKDEKGYKKIIYDDSEGNEYTIEHFYTPLKDSMSIKSYFQLNGQELNENGNVTSIFSQEEFVAKQSEQFVEDTFKGSLPGFLAAFCSRKKLSKDEVEALKRIIEENE